MSNTVTRGSRAAAAAVNWWSAKLSNPPVWDNADLGVKEDAILLYMALTTKTSEEDLEKIKIFNWVLYNKTRDALDNGEKVGLSTDYAPDGLLAEAAKIAGISEVRFPFKTRMVVTPDVVKVWCGVNASEERVFPPRY